MLDFHNRDPIGQCTNGTSDDRARTDAAESPSRELPQSLERPQIDFALTDGALVDIGPDRLGWFRFYFADDRWEWSAEVQRMHGYANGCVAVTTEVVISHQHPEDRPRVAAMIEQIRRTGHPFATQHRIVDTCHAVHDVVVLGSKLCNDSGHVVGTNGYYIDITLSERARHELLTAALPAIIEARAVIEQAKGMLMMIYRIDADKAFEILRWRSSATNVKVRRLSHQICTELQTLESEAFDFVAADRVVMTAHLRIEPRE